MKRSVRPIRLLTWGGPILAVAVLWVASRWFPVLDGIARAQRTIQDLGPLSVLAYPVLCAVCNVLLLPGGALVMGAGFFFGLWWGFAVALTGNVLGAALAMALARWVGRGWLGRKLAHHPRWLALNEAIDARGSHVVVLSQLHPFAPTSLLNYCYGITRLPFIPCLGWVALGQAPGLFLYVYLGTLGQRGLSLASGQWIPGTAEWFFWIAGLMVTVVITALLGRLALRMLEDIQARTSSAMVRDEGGTP